MKKILVISVIAAAALALVILSQRGGYRTGNRSRSTTQPPVAANPAARVPAHFADVRSMGQLPPTLPPERFFGQARLAYQVAQEIPQTLAQLPCYCYCDETLGHKSLHSCYETDHSASCATCVNEAILAYRLQKELGLTAPQIRERINAEFSRQ